MKLIYTLVTVFALLASNAYAENIVQFTGGNYVFVQDGKLTFNINHSLLENRHWVYNPETDTIETTFTTTNFDFRTKKSSEFFAYQTAFRQPETGLMHAGYHTNQAVLYFYDRHQHIYYYYDPHQKVFLPAVVSGLGMAVRVGGRIIASLIPPAISKFSKWCGKDVVCASAVGSIAFHVAGLCHLNQTNPVGAPFPFTLCKKIKEAGYDENGKITNSYIATVDGKSYRHATLATLKSKANEYCKLAGDKYVSQGYKYTGKYDFSEKRNTVHCTYLKPDGTETQSLAGWSWSASSEPIEMTVHDLNDLILKDVKENPNEYLKGAKAGKDDKIGDVIFSTVQAKQADINWSTGGGTFSVISSPYSEGDKVLQDVIVIGKPKTSMNANASGNPSTKTAGTSVTVNDVKVTNVNRDDLKDHAKPAESNDENGTGIEGSSTGKEKGDDNNDGKGGCKEGDNTLACAKMGDITDGDKNPFAIPNNNNTTQFNPDYFLPTQGVCPSPKILTVFGKSYEISYQPICHFAHMISYLIVMLAYLLAAYIIFGKKD